MIIGRLRPWVIFWRAVAEGAVWGVGAGGLYTVACAYVTIFGTGSTSVSELERNLGYFALWSPVFAAVGGLLGAVVGVGAGLVVGVALVVTIRTLPPSAPHAATTQRVVGAISGAVVVLPLGAGLAWWAVSLANDFIARERGVEVLPSSGDLIFVGAMFIAGPALITAAVCAWRSPAIVRSGVRDHSLGTPDQRLASVARLDNTAAASD